MPKTGSKVQAMVDYAFSLSNTEQLEGAWFYNEKTILRVIIENEMKDERNAGYILFYFHITFLQFRFPKDRLRSCQIQNCSSHNKLLLPEPLR